MTDQPDRDEDIERAVNFALGLTQAVAMKSGVCLRCFLYTLMEALDHVADNYECGERGGPPLDVSGMSPEEIQAMMRFLTLPVKGHA